MNINKIHTSTLQYNTIGAGYISVLYMSQIILKIFGFSCEEA